jgi:hypothetical protein
MQMLQLTTEVVVAELGRIYSVDVTGHRLRG